MANLQEPCQEFSGAGIVDHVLDLDPSDFRAGINSAPTTRFETVYPIIYDTVFKLPLGYFARW